MLTAMVLVGLFKGPLDKVLSSEQSAVVIT